MRSRHLGLEECYTPYLLFMLFGKTRIALLRTCLDAVPTVDAQLSGESKMSKEASKDNTTLDAVTSRMLILPNPESTGTIVEKKYETIWFNEWRKGSIAWCSKASSTFGMWWARQCSAHSFWAALLLVFSITSQRRPDEDGFCLTLPGRGTFPIVVLEVSIHSKLTTMYHLYIHQGSKWMTFWKRKCFSQLLGEIMSSNYLQETEPLWICFYLLSTSWLQTYLSSLLILKWPDRICYKTCLV